MMKKYRGISYLHTHTLSSHQINSNNKIQVYLPDFYAYRVPNTPESDSDYSNDMEDFGILVKRMLQIYHSRLKYSYSFDYARKPSKNPENQSEQSSRSSGHNLSPVGTGEEPKDLNENKTLDAGRAGHEEGNKGERSNDGEESNNGEGRNDGEESNNNDDEIDLNQSTQKGNYENGYSANSLNSVNGQVDEEGDKQLILYESNRPRDALIRRLKGEQNANPKSSAHLVGDEENDRIDRIERVDQIER